MIAKSKNINIDSVLLKEMEELINKLGIRKQLEDGQCKCKLCKTVINFDNLTAIFPINKQEIGFLCNQQRCLLNFNASRFIE